MAKKSRIRRIGKKIFLILQLLLTFLFLYPLFIKPLPFIWINGFLGLLAPYIVIAQLLLFIFWLLAKPWLSLIPLLTLVIPIFLGGLASRYVHGTKKERGYMSCD
jgi:hypothetical protein